MTPEEIRDQITRLRREFSEESAKAGELPRMYSDEPYERAYERALDDIEEALLGEHSQPA